MPRPTPNARGLTLIEVLAVVAILVVVSAIALPQIESRLSGARLDAAAGQLDATLIHARAEAQRRGVALRVVARRLKEGTALIFRPIAETDAAAGPRKEDQAPAATLGDVFGLLATGIELTDLDPNIKKDGAKEPSEPIKRSAATQGKDEVPDELLVATFLPDGSAIAAGRVYLVLGPGTYSITVNQWTGGGRIAAMALNAEGADRPVSQKSDTSEDEAPTEKGGKP